MRQLGQFAGLLALHQSLEGLQVLAVAGQQFVEQPPEHRRLAAGQRMQGIQVVETGGRRYGDGFGIDGDGQLVGGEAQGQQALLEDIEADGLDQALVHSSLDAALDLLRLGVRGEADDDHRLLAILALLLADRAGKVGAAHQRHVAVGDDHVERLPMPQVESAQAVLRFLHVMTEEAQLLMEDLPVDRMIVHHQHLQPPRLATAERDRPHVLDDRFQHLQAQLDVDPRTLPQLAAHHQAPSHHFAQRARDHQAEPGALGVLQVAVDLGERPEQLLLVAQGNTDAGVFHTEIDLQQRRLHLAAIDADADRALVGELDRVADQVGEDLLEAHGIQQYVAVDARIDLQHQAQALLPGQAFEYPCHRFHQLAQVGPFRRQAEAT